MEDFAQQMHTGMNFGIMNAMRTGSPIFDVLICMLIPVLFGLIAGRSHGDPLTVKIREALRAFFDWLTGTKTYIRYIIFEDRGRDYISDDRTALDTSARNNILQKALKLYLQENCKVAIDEAELNLLTEKSIKLEKDRWGDDCVFSGSYKQLLCYQVTKLPKRGHWIVIDNAHPALSFRQSMDSEEEGDGNNKKTFRTYTFELMARGAFAEQRVDNFVNMAFDWYKKKKSDEVDISRYLYQPMIKTSGGGADKDDSDGEGEGVGKYKRYLLSDDKTFDTLFFPEKLALIKLVDDFRDRKGKFEIPGFPNKLGVLLDGPPGTGKTSLIKALAIYLKRHIVSVSLEKIKTNQELMDMLFDLHFSVKGEDEPIKMKFNEVIFVMEDVDCASKVVYARKTWRANNTDSDALPPVSEQNPVASPAPLESITESGSAAVHTNAVCTTLTRTQTAPADFRKNTPFSTAQLLRQTSFRGVPRQSDEDDNGDDEEEEEQEKEEQPLDNIEGSDGEDKQTPGKEEKGGKLKSLKLTDDIDKLNLSGLLNVLDGVVDTPGRVLIMTTNHPEKLDPALIRPGRINKRIHLGYVTTEVLLQMAKHYVCRSSELPQHARKDAEDLCYSGRGITPAWVEQCSAEADDFDALVKALRLLKGAAPVRKSVLAPTRTQATQRW